MGCRMRMGGCVGFDVYIYIREVLIFVILHVLRLLDLSKIIQHIPPLSLLPRPSLAPRFQLSNN